MKGYSAALTWFAYAAMAASYTACCCAATCAAAKSRGFTMPLLELPIGPLLLLAPLRPGDIGNCWLKPLKTEATKLSEDSEINAYFQDRAFRLAGMREASACRKCRRAVARGQVRTSSWRQLRGSCSAAPVASLPLVALSKNGGEHKDPEASTNAADLERLKRTLHSTIFPLISWK